MSEWIKLKLYVCHPIIQLAALIGSVDLGLDQLEFPCFVSEQDLLAELFTQFWLGLCLFQLLSSFFISDRLLKQMALHALPLKLLESFWTLIEGIEANLECQIRLRLSHLVFLLLLFLFVGLVGDQSCSAVHLLKVSVNFFLKLVLFDLHSQVLTKVHFLKTFLRWLIHDLAFVLRDSCLVLIKHFVVVFPSTPQLILELFTSQICTTLGSLFIVDLLIEIETRLADNVVFGRIVGHAVEE